MSDNPTSGAFAGIAARNRQQAYDVLVDAIERSTLSQARIAEQAGISQEHLSRMLQRPRNVELDTLSKIIFAACGATLRVDLSFPALATTADKKPADHLHIQSAPDPATAKQPASSRSRRAAS